MTKPLRPVAKRTDAFRLNTRLTLCQASGCTTPAGVLWNVTETVCVMLCRDCWKAVAGKLVLEGKL